MREQSLGDTKALADVYTVSAEPRFKINSFSLPFGSQGVEVHGSSWKFMVMGPALTASQEPRQYQEAFHLWDSGKENTSHDIPIRRCPLGPFRPHPWLLTLSCWAVIGQPRPNKEFIQRVPGGREVLFPVETRENYPTTRAPDHKCL